MLIILDKTTKEVKENTGTNSMFPHGNIPIEERSDEIYIRLHDDSEFANQILSAYDYRLILNEENVVTDVIVNKTLEEYNAEQPEPQKDPTPEEKINQLEQENVTNMLAMTDMYEENIKLKQENVDTMMAVTELYEMMLGGTV